ncbi:hypothetical protein ACA086_03200 [Muriicola sp. E247]|uniref:hypothetical protein n=1 Tax=Muriicola sp. E247 TaxID=3242730 RepID=UPI0035254ACE
MKYSIKRLVMPVLIAFFCSAIWAQPGPGVYLRTDSESTDLIHEIKMNGNYLVYTEYTTAPDFVRTRGGFYTVEGDSIKVQLEFNSAYENDGAKAMAFSYSMDGDKLVLNEGKPIGLKQVKSKDQDLDGAWLFATRGPDTGQDRRGESNPRKTLKFLMDGHFQWIAYHTETMRFSGTGGGSFTSEDGVYTENIDYFSRDNSRVGASLNFNYERKGDDWHHTGKNSRGEPMYEIWAIRK